MAFEQHFQRLKSHYGADVHVVSLLEEEEPLNKVYQSHLQRMHIPYNLFDWNHIIKQKGDELKLTRAVCSVIDRQGMFVNLLPYATRRSETNPPVVMTKAEQQVGLIRMNCLDCLDRTNCAQYEVARMVLPRQLLAVGIIPQEAHERAEGTLSKFWAANGDQVSYHYTGSPALNSEWILHASKTTSGMLQNSIVSARRYWGNNFGSDGDRHTALQLFYGKMETQCLQARPALGVAGTTSVRNSLCYNGRLPW